MIFLWIILYGLIHTALSRLGGIGSWVRAFSVLIYSVLLMQWTFRRKHLPKARVIPQCPRDWIVLAALAVMPLCNILTGRQRVLNGSDIVFMLGVCITEELFFREHLLSFLRKKNDFFGVMGTGVVFAVLHLGNGLQNAEMQYVLIQTFCAFFVSVLYCAVVIRFHNLAPCMVAHFFTNLSGAGAIETIIEAMILCICAVICGVCGIWSFLENGNTQRGQFDAAVY